MADLIFTIKTPAELQGAQAAAAALEVNIGKAKGLGKEYAEIEKQLAKTKASIDVYTASLKESQKPADDSARYQATLQQMSERGDAEKLLQREARQTAEATKLSAAADEEAKRATDQLADSVKVYTQDELAELEQKTGKATDAKAQMRQAIKGLSLEYPILGRIAMLALNPITIAVTAAAAATAIYRTRVAELTNTFSTAQLPDYNAGAFQRLTEAVDVWTKLGDAVKEALNKFNSPSAASDRRIEQLKQTVELKKEELAMDKALEIAALERNKDQMSGLDYANARVEIEDRYGSAGMAMDAQLEQRLLSEQMRRAMALGISGRDKAEAAAGIGIATAEEDALMEEELRARAEASQAAIAERRKRISDIEAFQAGELSPAQQLALAAQRVQRGETFVTGGESIKNEREQIAAEQINVDRYNAFLKRRQERDRERERKARLESEAAAEISEAAAIEAGLPEDDKLRRERAAARERIERKRIELESLKGEETARQIEEQRESKRRSKGSQALEANRESFQRSSGSISPDLSGVTVDTQPVADEMAKLVATISGIVANANQAIADARSQSRDSMLG